MTAKPGFWVLAFAVGIRLLFLSELVRMPYFDFEADAFDEINFHKGGLALAAGDWRAPSGNELYSPLYKYCIGGVYALAAPFTDLRIGVVRVLQLGLGVAVAWWVFRLGSRWGGTAAGVAASVLYSALGQALFMEAKLLREFPATAAMVAALWTARDGPAHPRRWLASAVLLGVACQFRSNLELVALLFLGWGWKAGWRRAAAWGGVFVLTLVPSMARNALVLGAPDRPGLSESMPKGRLAMFTLEPQGPIVLAVANSPTQDEPYCKPGSINPDPAIQEYGGTVTPSMGRTLRMVLGWAREDPWAFARLQLRKLYWTLWDGEVASNHNFYLWQEFCPALRSPLSHVGLFVAFLCGVLCVPVLRRAVPGALWAVLGAVLLGVLIAFPAGRVRAPAYPLLAMASALAGAALVRELRAGRRAVLAAPAVGALLFAALLPPEPAWIRSVSGMAYPNSREKLLRYLDVTNVAVTHARQGTPEDFRRIERIFTRARNLALLWGPDHVAHVEHDLGEVCRMSWKAQMGAALPEEALSAALRWERACPMEGDPHGAAAEALRQLGLGEAGALAVYRALLRNPDGGTLENPPPPGEIPPDPEVSAALASKDLPALIALATRGRLLRPEDLLAFQSLGPGDAWSEWALLRALLKDPAFPGAHRGLAVLYRRQGMPHRALFHLRAMLGEDPPGAGELLDAEMPMEVPAGWLRVTRTGGT